MQDLIYYFDKITLTKNVYGEIQSGFNMSFVIDGTKDSCKIEVYNFDKKAVLPYTIFYHETTNSWWVAVHDKVERYDNEVDYVYKHTIQFLGAIELLNARDLTDCGFNANRYTIRQFLTRLFALSNYELPITFSGNIDFDEYVEDIKTFENYTLLSALREFLNAYNCSGKLSFNVSNNVLSSSVLNIIPKTGGNGTVLDESIFDDVRETKTIDKGSYGATVVSNANNVISSKNKIFPSVGSVRLSSTEYKITGDNAVLRLPSSAFKVNSIKMKFPLKITIANSQGINFKKVYFDNVDSVNEFVDYTKSLFAVDGQSVVDDFEEHVVETIEKLKKASTVTFYNNDEINPVTGEIVKGKNTPYIPVLYKNTIWQGKKQVVLCNKKTRDCLPYKEQGIYWERGSNLIHGFNFFNDQENALYHCVVDSLFSTDLQEEIVYFYQAPYTGSQPIDYILIEGASAPTTTKYIDVEVSPKNTTFIIDYIPMADIKIKVDNVRNAKDIQLYNQNGKITDANALSKLVNSYAKEISSDTITKHAYFFNLTALPKVGDSVYIDNMQYVITNTSFDFFPNETSYYADSEITLSKYTVVKSLMVSPNTNVRDYGIPQEFNIKRKQLIRDYLEFDYEKDTNSDSGLINTNVPLNFSPKGYTLKNHFVAIECIYDEAIENSNTYYYQLETTTYKLKKQYIEVLDFGDNNIIGYGSQNVHSAFQLQRIFTAGLIDDINTPISYVDSKGEIAEINLAWANGEQIAQSWEAYKNSEGYSDNNEISLYNYSIFIPADIYYNLDLNADFHVEYPDYGKDALEVPVFEYVFQIGDSDNILVGDNILDNELDEDYFYMYGFLVRPAGSLNQNNALRGANVVVGVQGKAYLTRSVELSNGSKLTCKFYASGLYDPTTERMSYNQLDTTISAPCDICIYRVKVNKTFVNVKKDVVMILKNVDANSTISSGTIVLEKNYYNLK